MPVNETFWNPYRWVAAERGQPPESLLPAPIPGALRPVRVHDGVAHAVVRRGRTRPVRRPGWPSPAPVIPGTSLKGASAPGGTGRQCGDSLPQRAGRCGASARTSRQRGRNGPSTLRAASSDISAEGRSSPAWSGSVMPSWCDHRSSRSNGRRCGWSPVSRTQTTPRSIRPIAEPASSTITSRGPPN